MGNQLTVTQLLVQRFGDIILDHQRVPLAQTIAGDKRLIHLGLNIHQRLIDTHNVGFINFIMLRLLQQRIAGINREIVFRLALTGNFI